MEHKDSRTFKINPEIEMKKVQFMNRYGITLAGDLYLPKNYEDKKNPAVIVAGPFGAVKEQASGLYAQELAARGFVSIPLLFGRCLRRSVRTERTGNCS